MCSAVPFDTSRIARMTAEQALTLGRLGALWQCLEMARGPVEAVLERWVGVQARVRFIVPRATPELSIEHGGKEFDGVALRVACIEPCASFVVLVPWSLAVQVARVALNVGTVAACAQQDEGALEAVVALLAADVIRCLPASLPAARLEAAVRVRPGGVWMPHDDRAAIAWARVRVGPSSDLVTMVVPQGSLEVLASAAGRQMPVPRSVLELRFPVALVVARASVEIGQLARLTVGDILIADTVAPGLGATGPGPGTVCDLAAIPVSGIRFVARALIDGARLSVVEGQSMLLEGDMQRHDEETVIDATPGVARDGARSGGKRVELLPAEVVVEAGRVTLSVGQLMELAPGTVIPLHRPPTMEVALTSGGREIASGVLVVVEGDLGIQILRIAG